MKKFFTLTLLCVAFSSIKAQDATFGWQISGGGTKADRSVAVTTDSYGYVYTANTFQESATFNGVVFTGAPKGSGANPDVSLLINKIDPASRATLWSVYSNDGVVAPVSMATSTVGDLYVVGTIRAVKNTADQTTGARLVDGAGAVHEFTGLAETDASGQAFIAKFNSNGSIVWVKEINSDVNKLSSVVPSSVAVDATGDVYLSGTYTSTLMLPGVGTVLTSSNTSKSAYLIKLNGNTGGYEWHLVSDGGLDSEEFGALAIGDDGYLYAAGVFKMGTAPLAGFGGHTLTPATGSVYDLVVAKISTAGAVQYVQNRSNTSDTRLKDIAVADGKIFVAGSLKGSISFAQRTLTVAANYLNGFVAAFSTIDGSDLWHNSITSGAIVEANSLAIGSNNRLYVFGNHYNALGNNVPSGVVDFGNGVALMDTPTSNKLGDIFLAGYDLSGMAREAHLVASSANSETGNALSAHDGKLYFLGTTNSAALTFQNGEVYTTAGSFDIVFGAYGLPTSGIGEGATQATAVYYDSANKSIVIKGDADLKQLSVTNLAGRKVYTVAVDGTREIRVDLSQGVYLVTLVDKVGKTLTNKVLVY